MIVNLAEQRQQRAPSIPNSEFALDDPRRWNRLSLEQQKKRAKEFLKSIRAADAAAVERLRHSRSDHLPLSAVRLSDAQLVIARENGFRKWEDLKAHIDSVRSAEEAVRNGEPTALDDERTLHIRCGTDIQHKLSVAGFSGDFLGFWDPYVTGPVPDTSVDELIQIRSTSIGIPLEELTSMYRSLERAVDYDSIALWFEYDAFDQLILAKLLDYFANLDARPERIRFISTERFPGVQNFNGIGQLPSDALRVLWNDFRDVEAHEFIAAEEAWRAITCATPELLLKFVDTVSSVLPTMRRALDRHLRELPSVTNGLSLSEETTLRILSDSGPMSVAALAGRFLFGDGSLIGMGDRIYVNLLRRLAEAEHPAVHIHDALNGENVWNCKVELLPLGSQLLNDAADWLKRNNVRRWVGGVCIDSRSSEKPWRFDRLQRFLLRQ